MGLFRNMECRHIGGGNERSTVALEPEFWREADRHAQAAGMTSREWIQAQLKSKPAEQGRASWLRVALLKSGCNCRQRRL